MDAHCPNVNFMQPYRKARFIKAVMISSYTKTKKLQKNLMVLSFVASDLLSQRILNSPGSCIMLNKRGVRRKARIGKRRKPGTI